MTDINEIRQGLEGTTAGPLREITLLEGKYTMRQKQFLGFALWDEPLRYGEEWPAYTDSGPSNLECALADRILDLEDRLEAAERERDEARAAITGAIAEMKLIAAERDQAKPEHGNYYLGVAAAIDTLEIYFARALAPSPIGDIGEKP